MFIYMGANNNYNPDFVWTLYSSVSTYREKYEIVFKNKVLGKRNVECEFFLFSKSRCLWF